MFCKWRSHFVANNYWRGGWRTKLSSFLDRLGNAQAAWHDISKVFKEKRNLESKLSEYTKIADTLGESNSLLIAENETLLMFSRGLHRAMMSKDPTIADEAWRALPENLKERIDDDS